MTKRPPVNDPRPAKPVLISCVKMALLFGDNPAAMCGSSGDPGDGGPSGGGDDPGTDSDTGTDNPTGGDGPRRDPFEHYTTTIVLILEGIPEANDSATADRVQETGSANPECDGRFQIDPSTGKRVDTGNQCSITTVTVPEITVSGPQVPAIPAMILNVIGAGGQAQQIVGDGECGYAAGQGTVDWGGSADFISTDCEGGGDPECATADYIDLYHGTHEKHVESIKSGIDLEAGTALQDFGKGFYLTKHRSQAEAWASKRYGTKGAVIHYRVPIAALGSLNGRNFPSASAEWLEAVLAGRAGESLGYDYVQGPYLKNVEEAKAGAPPDARGHQLSIHTQQAVDVFDGCVR